MNLAKVAPDRKAAILAVRECHDVAELQRVVDGSPWSTVRTLAERRIRHLTLFPGRSSSPGRPRRREEETKSRAIGMTDAEWAEVAAFAEESGTSVSEGGRRLIAVGLKNVGKKRSGLPR